MMESSHKIFWTRTFLPLVKQNKYKEVIILWIFNKHIIKDIIYNCIMITSQGYSGLKWCVSVLWKRVRGYGFQSNLSGGDFFTCWGAQLKICLVNIPIAGLFLNKDISSFLLICYTKCSIGWQLVKSACGIEAVYMCLNGTGIWGGETLYRGVARISQRGVRIFAVGLPVQPHI